MNRRHFLRIPALAAMSCPALATPANFTENGPLPFVELGPFVADRQRVYEFFLFGCPYCRAYAKDFGAWGASLPDPIRFDKVPIPLGPGGMQAARAWFAVALASGRRDVALTAFEDAVFELIQDRGAAVDLEQTYRDAATQGSVDADLLERSWRSPRVRNDVIEARRLCEEYGLTNTPSLAIGGRFVTHAEYVGGDYSLLFNLANGLVSRLLPDSSTHNVSPEK